MPPAETKAAPAAPEGNSLPEVLNKEGGWRTKQHRAVLHDGASDNDPALLEAHFDMTLGTKTSDYGGHMWHELKQVDRDKLVSPLLVLGNDNEVWPAFKLIYVLGAHDQYRDSFIQRYDEILKIAAATAIAYATISKIIEPGEARSLCGHIDLQVFLDSKFVDKEAKLDDLLKKMNDQTASPQARNDAQEVYNKAGGHGQLRKQVKDFFANEIYSHLRRLKEEKWTPDKLADLDLDWRPKSR